MDKNKIYVFSAITQLDKDKNKSRWLELIDAK